MAFEEHETIKTIVEGVLEDDEKARDNDIWLILQTLRRMGFHIFINYGEIHKIPSFETITRIRREIQNKEGRFLAAQEVENARKGQPCEGLTRNSQLDFE